MKSPTLKLPKVHRLIGLSLCLILVTISVTGVLLVWKREYLWLTIPAAREATVFDIQNTARAIDTIEAAHPSGSVKLIQLHSENLALHKVFLSNKYYAWHKQNGELVQQWTNNERIEDWLLDLHHRFLLGNTIGLNIAGFGGLLALPLLILGLAIWWPRRRLFRLGILPKNLQHGMLQRSHGNLGALTLLPALLLCITGVILVYPSQAQTLFLASKTTPIAEPKIVSSKQIDSWLSRLQLAEQVYPQSRLRWVTPASAKYPTHMVGVQQESAWNRMGNSTLSFKANNTTIPKNALIAPTNDRLLAFAYPLHTGKLPLWYRICLTLFGTALAALSLLGLGSYLRRKL